MNPYLNDGCQFFASISGSCLSSLKPVIILPSSNCKFKCTSNLSVVCKSLLSRTVKLFICEFCDLLFFISASDDNNSEVVEVVDSNTLEEISFDEQRGGSYLTLEEVAAILFHLASNGNYLLLTIIRERNMAKWLARLYPGVGSPKSPSNEFSDSH